MYDKAGFIASMEAWGSYSKAFPPDYRALRLAYKEYNWDTSFQANPSWEREMDNLFEFVEQITTAFRSGDNGKVWLLLDNFSHRRP